jgi:hypothetical protein
LLQKAKAAAAKLPGNIQQASQAVKNAAEKASLNVGSLYQKAQDQLDKIPLVGKIPPQTRNRLIMGLALSMVGSMVGAHAADGGQVQDTGGFDPGQHSDPGAFAPDQAVGGDQGGGAGEGEIAVCGNEAQADSLRTWSNFGFSTDRTSDTEGTNANMSEMNAAYGLFSIRIRILESEDWLKSQKIVSVKTKDYSWKTFVNSHPRFHPYWIISFKDKQDKGMAVKKLEEANIQSREWWAKPLSLQKAFSESSSFLLNGSAKHLSDAHLGLPMYRGLSSENIQEICDVVQSAISK